MVGCVAAVKKLQCTRTFHRVDLNGCSTTLRGV
jgi:hypothetical protein